MKQASITGLEDAQGRHPDDYYVTPAWVTQAVVPWLGSPRRILDLACGAGAIGEVLRLTWPNAEIHGIDYSAARRTVCSSLRVLVKADLLSVYQQVIGLDFERVELLDWLQAVHPYDLIISNPPFSAALTCLRPAVDAGGTVAFLLPGQWDQETEVKKGRERLNFLDSLRLPDGREGYGKYAIEGRIDFRGNGSTDRICYAWYVFGPGHEGVYRRIPVLSKVTAEQGALCR